MTHKTINPNKKIVVRIDPEIEDLIPTFLNNRKKDVESLQQALQTGDFESIKKLGHNLKGSGGSYGFDAIFKIGIALENAAAKKNTESIQDAIGELADFLARVNVVFE